MIMRDNLINNHTNNRWDNRQIDAHEIYELGNSGHKPMSLAMAREMSIPLLTTVQKLCCTTQSNPGNIRPY